MILKSNPTLPNANAIKCLTCDTIIESTYTHDFQPCKCENDSTKVYVDGGKEYYRALYGDKAKWQSWTNGRWT